MVKAFLRTGAWKMLLCVGLSLFSILFTSCDDHSPKDSSKPATVIAKDTGAAKVVEVPKDSIHLRYNVEPGDVFRYKVVQNTKVEQNGLQSENNVVFFYTKKVIAVRKDTSVTFAFQFDAISLLNKLPNPDTSSPEKFRSITYNSKDSNNRKDQRFTQYNSLIGQEVEITVTPMGEILKMTKVDRIAAKMLGKYKDSASAEDKEQLVHQIERDAFAMVLQQEVQSYPKILDSDKSWETSYSVPLIGIFPTENTVRYKIESVLDMKGRKVAQISAHLSAKVLENKETKADMTATLKKSAINGSGKHLVDLSKGFTILKNNKLISDIVVETTDSKTKKSMDVQQKTVVESSVELL